jgi:hypothetical protein
MADFGVSFAQLAFLGTNLRRKAIISICHTIQ